MLTLMPPAPSGYPESQSLIVAKLTDATGRALGEKNIFFVVSGAGGSYSAAEITDYAGRAVLNSVPLLHGLYSVKAYFSGIVPLSTGESVTLSDVRYLPSTALAQLTVLNHAPVAANDVYTLTQGSVLTVTAPGVLGNDSDADHDPLTASIASNPLHGALTFKADGSFVYTPQAGFYGIDTFTYTVTDNFSGRANGVVTLVVQKANQPPICTAAQSNPLSFWPPNGTFYSVTVQDVTDPDNDPVSITFTGIRQDEPTGSNWPDAHILGPNQADVRAERLGSGDGRVYHLFFTAQDNHGNRCAGQVLTAIVPHDQGNIGAVDGGPLYDSLAP